MEAGSLDAAERRLWLDYRAGAAGARDTLLERYLPLAKRLAASLYAKRTVDDIEFGDYLHLAYTGLLEAMQRYRHEDAAHFATFATYRIRGAMLNGIPRMTEIGDQIATRREMQRERTRSLQGGDKPSLQLAGLADLVIGIALTYQLEEIAEADELHLHSTTDPYASREYDDMQRRLRGILDRLPERERKIVYYHYFHQLPFDEIATLFELTKGRISQLHKLAIETLRDVLQKSRLTELY
jgi:RNA polymerase sigma factor FliA